MLISVCVGLIVGLKPTDTTLVGVIISMNVITLGGAVYWTAWNFSYQKDVVLAFYKELKVRMAPHRSRGGKWGGMNRDVRVTFPAFAVH